MQSSIFRVGMTFPGQTGANPFFIQPIYIMSRKWLSQARFDVAFCTPVGSGSMARLRLPNRRSRKPARRRFILGALLTAACATGGAGPVPLRPVQGELAITIAYPPPQDRSLRVRDGSLIPPDSSEL